MCGRPLTGSWSKGRNGYHAYYDCQRQCRAVNGSKTELEGAFADELALLQPTAGYMRLVKDRILHLWEQRRAEAKDRTAEQEKRVREPSDGVMRIPADDEDGADGRVLQSGHHVGQVFLVGDEPGGQMRRYAVLYPRAGIESAGAMPALSVGRVTSRGVC